MPGTGLQVAGGISAFFAWAALCHIGAALVIQRAIRRNHAHVLPGDPLRKAT